MKSAYRDIVRVAIYLDVFSLTLQYHPKYSISPNYESELRVTNVKVGSLTISDQYVLIKYGQRMPRDAYPDAWELWKLNSTNSVQIPLPDYRLYLTEDIHEDRIFISHWLLDPSATPRYLVCIVYTDEWELGERGQTAGVVVLVFDLNDPQFLHRLALPVENSKIVPSITRLITTKGVEQTALVIHQNDRMFISDLVNDFKEITESLNQKAVSLFGYFYTTDGVTKQRMSKITTCIGLHGEMYRTELPYNGYSVNHPNGDSYYMDVYFDGVRFLLNETKVEKLRYHTDAVFRRVQTSVQN